jgi:hypothetical protein
MLEAGNATRWWARYCTKRRCCRSLHFAALENVYFRPRTEFCSLSLFSDYGPGKRVYLHVIKVFKRTMARRSASLVNSSASKRRVRPSRLSVCGTFTSQHVHTACLLQPPIPIHFPLLLNQSLLAATVVNLPHVNDQYPR